MSPDDFISRVTACGLAAKYLGGADDRIMGGSAWVDLPGGIGLFENSFAVFRVPEGMQVVLVGPGLNDREYLVRGLDEALAIVLREYGRE